MKNDTPTDVAAAINDLVQGYREEAHLYRHVSKLIWKQRTALREGRDLNQFQDLENEKGAFLRMIGLIESEMRDPKAVVLCKMSSECPDRWQLEMLLDYLTETIEEIRMFQGANASFLCATPTRARLVGAMERHPEMLISGATYSPLTLEPVEGAG